MPKHIPVLLQEVLRGIDLKGGETFVDGTYGGGGHTNEVRRRYPSLRIITIDQDPEARADFTENFRNIDKVLGDPPAGGRPDCILLDLGFSSPQIEGSVPGLSFLRNEPLDMRLSRKGATASDILNSYDESVIELIIRGFGEERHSRAIARRIVERRKKKPFQTTFDLVEVVGGRRGKTHPATRTFQALRIAVNEELPALEEGLEKGFEILRPGGRLAVISFHSLEDRIVKNFFRDLSREGRGTLITRKPITPSEDEIRGNPRSRSAKLRIIKKNV